MTESTPIRFSGPALASFVLGLFAVLANMPLLSPPAALIAIVLAVIGIKQTSSTNFAGRNLALTGLIAGVLALFVLPLLNIALSKNQSARSTDEFIRTNEEHVLAGLHAYGKAQETVLRGGYGKLLNQEEQPGYCRDFTHLPEVLVEQDGKAVPLMDDNFASATSEESPFHGYYFVQGPVSERSHVLYAFPVAYGKSGRRTFRVDHTGTILACDLGSQHPDLSASLDKLQWQPVFSPESLPQQSTERDNFPETGNSADEKNLKK